MNSVNQMTIPRKIKSILELEDRLKQLKLPNGDSIDGFVYKTSNPNQFGDVKGNRIINDESVYSKRLSESLIKYGNVSPIIINDNEEIIDGQRRVMAIKKYNIKTPLRYTRISNADINTVGDINRLQVKWSYKDWMHKYIEMNLIDYIEYNQLEETYGKYMRGRSLRSLLMNGKIESFKSDVWESGNFIINKASLPNVISFLDFLILVNNIGGNENIFAKNRNFQKSLWEVYSKTENFSEALFLKKIQLNFNKLNVRIDSDAYYKILNKFNGIVDIMKKPIGRPRKNKSLFRTPKKIQA